MGCSAGVGACLQLGVKVCATDQNSTVCNAVPGQPTAETCNGIDDDCDGSSDEGLPLQTWYRDGDADGYGDPGQTRVDCQTSPPSGYAAQAGDCNDTQGDVSPGAPETCNGTDDDCDGTVDEGCCTLECSAVVPGSGSGSGPVAFQATATVTGTNCTGTPSFTWSFGDGASATGQNVTHSYSTAGTFNWTLTVSWQDKVCTRSGTITITRLLTITNPSATGQYETGQLTVALSGTAAEPLKVAPTWRNERTGKYYTMDSGEFVALFPSAEYAARYVTDPAQDPQGRRFLRTTCNAHSIPLCDALAGSLVINAMK